MYWTRWVIIGVAVAIGAMTAGFLGEQVAGPTALRAQEPTKKNPREAALQLRPTPGKIIPGNNLLPNGNLDEGENRPIHWQAIDGLSTFWVKDNDPQRGRVLKVDTDILQSQGYAWWVKIAKGANPADAPKKLPTVEPKYDTLAGLDGVWFWSDPIPIEKGKSYWLTVDVKGPAMLVWLVGYPEQPDTSFGADNGAFVEVLQNAEGKKTPNVRGREAFIHKYIWKGQLAVGGSSEWKTYSRRDKPFQPTKFTPKVKYVRVMLYPFWPPGQYYIDNVRLVEYRAEAAK